MVDIYALKRIVSGLKIKDSKVLECDDTHCVITGSGKEPYTVTRDTCTCTDFLINDLPELIAMFDRYYQDGAITADKYCKIVSALSK